MLSLETRGAEGRGKERTGAEKCCVELRGAALKVVLKAVLKAVPPASFRAGGASSLILITLGLGMRMYVVERSFLVGPPHPCCSSTQTDVFCGDLGDQVISVPALPWVAGGAGSSLILLTLVLAEGGRSGAEFPGGASAPWLGEERRGEERRGEERRGEERRGEERTGQDRTGQDRTRQDRRGDAQLGAERSRGERKEKDRR
ncbi:hypothetical protein DUI87_32042 [Hirundo rustica rustica]|uniref:Uncharacterized protein n=1 Tax=Hirundo rustica rustica TaxID=333673 RepID=A0A3M0IXJ6_HIRRU|nr:hypothetical protein DUI87_32042 [Hirundo rustica rustica]